MIKNKTKYESIEKIKTKEFLTIKKEIIRCLKEVKDLSEDSMDWLMQIDSCVDDIVGIKNYLYGYEEALEDKNE